MKTTNITFKHERFNLIQAIYGDLSEDASLMAVNEVEEKLEKVFDAIEDAAKDNKNFGDSNALEICVNMASTVQELVIFVHSVSSKSQCPTHPFIQMITGNLGGGEPPK